MARKKKKRPNLEIFLAVQTHTTHARTGLVMDVFKLLSRGANIQRNGKHKDDLSLFNGRGMSSKVINESRVGREVDFFRSATKRSEQAKEKSVRKEQVEEQINTESSILVISNEEEAALYRKKHKIKISGEDIPLPIGSFTDIKSKHDLHGHLLKSLSQQKFEKPTPIQSQAIPILLHGRDLIACAPTGSGKTLAYSIPVVQSLKQHSNKGIRCLVISPTKELATQIYNETLKLKGRDLSIGILTKATAAKMKYDTMSKQNYDILISTPLRLVDSISQNLIDLSQVQYLVLDEADKLFEQGFLNQTDDILSACTNPRLQKALFSATIPSGVEEMANSIMFSPVRVIVGLKEGASDDIDQRLVFTGNEEGKLIAIRQLIQEGEINPPVIIFVQSIQRAKALFHELIYDKMNVDAIHSEKTQSQREKIIDRFKKGDIWILICTEVLARGIDFQGVNLVINYDVPQTSQAYVHRIGRTGRAGRQGKAVTFFTNDDQQAVKNVINVMKQSGCSVDDWMLKMPKMNQNLKKKLKNRPIDRSEISTVPTIIRQKRKERKEMIEASKRRKTIMESKQDDQDDQGDQDDQDE